MSSGEAIAEDDLHLRVERDALMVHMKNEEVAGLDAERWIREDLTRSCRWCSVSGDPRLQSQGKELILSDRVDVVEREIVWILSSNRAEVRTGGKIYVEVSARVIERGHGLPRNSSGA